MATLKIPLTNAFIQHQRIRRILVMRMHAFAMISQPTGSAKDTIQIRLRICNDKRYAFVYVPSKLNKELTNE